MTKPLVLAALAALLFLSGRQAPQLLGESLSEQGREQRAYPEQSQRGNARIFYWGGNRSAGQLAIDYGVVPWKKAYDDALAGAKFDDRRWRLGQNFWTNLDTNIDLDIAGERVPAGYWYLTLERRSDDGKFILTVLDPDKVRARKLDSYHAHHTKGGIEIPMSYSKVEAVAGKLTLQLSIDKGAKDRAVLTIRFGAHKLTAPVQMHA